MASLGSLSKNNWRISPGGLNVSLPGLCAAQIVDPSILKQYIFQKGFVTEAAKARREAEAQNATLQARRPALLATRGAGSLYSMTTQLVKLQRVVKLQRAS